MIQIDFGNLEAFGADISRVKEAAELFFFSLGDSGVRISLNASGKSVTASDGERFFTESRESITNAAKAAVYRLLSFRCGFKPPWGILTGVRPVNLIGEILEKYGLEEAKKLLETQYFISGEKTEAALQVYLYQKNFIIPQKNRFALYVNVPMCVSRCSYCSFPSAVTGEGSELTQRYLDALIKEIEALGSYARERKLECDCAYIGGGTPSVFNVKQCECLLNAVNIITGGNTELTFEAGRCDTLNEEKFRVFKEMNVTRISLNPQSVSDKTLSKVNRCVTHGRFLEMYEIARKTGHDNINCDIIFGLEDETDADCLKSVSEISSLKPENITLHALCAKRGSEAGAYSAQTKTADVNVCMENARSFLKGEGYTPYYLYRQQHASHGAENTGYERNSSPCLYNMRIMGRKEDILSAGAASATTAVLRGVGYRNIYNVKDLNLYINDIDNIINRKIVQLENIYSE